MPGLFTVSGLFVACSRASGCNNVANRQLWPVFVVSGCLRRLPGVLAVSGSCVRTLYPGRLCPAVKGRDAKST
eukprot:13580344-Alexandrium_andersonii.AAC.1